MTAIDLAKRGARVVLACRSRERGEAALADVKRVRPDPRLVSPLAPARPKQVPLSPPPPL